MGVLVALALALVAAVYFIRRRRQNQQAAVVPPLDLDPSDTTFEPTEEVQVIVPFVAPSRPSETAPKSTTSDMQEGDPSNPEYLTVSEKRQEPSSSQGDASSSTGSNGGPAHRPIQHAEDMEDAEDDSLLPPMYKASWGQRYASGGADDGDSVAVARMAEAGQRAEDRASSKAV